MGSQRADMYRTVVFLVLAVVVVGAALLDRVRVPTLSTLAFPALLLASALLCLAAWQIVDRAARSDPLDLRLLDAGLIVLAVSAALGLALGTAGWLSFRSLVFWAGAAGLPIAAWVWSVERARLRRGEAGARTASKRTEEGEDKLRHYEKSMSAESTRSEGLDRAALALVAGLVAFGVVQAVLGRVFRPPVGDPLAYHLPFAVEWLQGGSLAMPVPAAGDPSTPFYPLNSSLWMFWALAPFESEILARYVQLPFLALLGLAAFRLGLEIGLRWQAALVAGALAVTVPDIARSASLPENDLILAALLVAATACLARLWRRPTGWRAAMAALALGLAAGTKVLALPVVGLLGVAWLVIVILRWALTGWRGLAALLATGAGLVLALGGYSYVRNAVVMENPLYPAGYVVAGRELFEGLYVMTWEWRKSHAFFPFDWSGFFLGMRRSFGWTVTWWLLPGLALAVGLVAVKVIQAARARAWKGASRGLLLPVALILWVPLTLLIFWFVIPYHFSRFLFPTIVWGIVAATWGFDALIRRFSIPRAALPMIALPCLAVNVLNMPLDPSVRQTLRYWVAAAVVVGGVTGLGMAAQACFSVRWKRQPNPRRGDPTGRPYMGLMAFTPVSALGDDLVRRIVGLVVALAVLAASIAWPLYERQYEERRFDEWRLQIQSFSQITDAWEWIDRQTASEPAVIAVAGTNEIYPLYGEGLENRVVTVWHSGELAQYGWGEPFTLYGEPNREAWLRQIEQSGVDYIYMTENVSFGGWPVERQWVLDDGAHFELAYENPDVEIWAVRRNGEAGYTVPPGIDR